ncbi:hypothetical protein Tco_1231925 [Tanacetum coccineum]
MYHGKQESLGYFSRNFAHKLWILSPYATLSILVPEWFTWHGFVIICTFMTIVKGYNVIFAWFNQKVVLAVRYTIDKLWELVFGTDQLPIVVGASSDP